MAYAPGVNDISGQLLAAGIGGAADRISEGIDKYRLTAKEISHLKGATEFAAQQGLLSPEDLAAFEGGNLAKKREIGIRAGMLYSDAQEKQKLTLQREELEALNTYRMGSLGMQGRQLSMSEAEQAAILPLKTQQMALSAANAAEMAPLEVANIKARTARTEAETNAFTDPLQAPEFDPARDLIPLPGTNYFGLRSPATGGISPIPGVGAGGPAFAPTEQDKAMAKEAGYYYAPGKDGPELKPVRKGELPSPAQGAVNAVYSVTGKPTEEQLRVRMKQIVDETQASSANWTKINSLGETRSQELNRLDRELREQLSGKAAPATPAEPGTGEYGAAGVLPKLEEIPNLSELPTMTPEQAETLPSGAYFRTTDGRIIRKR